MIWGFGLPSSRFASRYGRFTADCSADIALDGIVVVTSPQELANMVVTKAINMANKMDVPIFGLVENMSYAICPL